MMMVAVMIVVVVMMMIVVVVVVVALVVVEEAAVVMGVLIARERVVGWLVGWLVVFFLTKPKGTNLLNNLEGHWCVHRERFGRQHSSHGGLLHSPGCGGQHEGRRGGGGGGRSYHNVVTMGRCNIIMWYYWVVVLS